MKKSKFVKLLLKQLRWLGIILAIAYLLMCAFLFFIQPRLIFFPSSVIEKTPAYYNLAYEEVWLPIKTASGIEKIHGWWIPNSRNAQVLLYLHGNGINIGANAGHANNFHRMGFSVLLIDYRGYGPGLFHSTRARSLSIS
jgi:hypothetical protein